MAQRRMFSPHIVDSDAFLDMSASAQCLYFHLGMRADDDGFVGNPKKILRMIGGNDDDLKILIAKRFILIFESGVVVIKHWKIHNYIQNDRYKETKYLEEKEKIITKENGSYTECIQNVSSSDTQVRLGKDRVEVGKVRLVVQPKDSDKTKENLLVDLFNAFWEEYPIKKGKDLAKKRFMNLTPGVAVNLIDDVKKRKTQDRQWIDGYAPHPPTYLNQKVWEDEIEPPLSNKGPKLESGTPHIPGKYSEKKGTLVE